ncbi:MAG TPA: hypothetical protein VIK51_09030 [Vicinamibacteria bacterium]|jgi:HAMP domain-containing protein
MRATARARLTIGFLALAAIGSVVSVAILATLSHSLDELRRVVTVSDVIEHKALEMRFDVLAMSDARRGFLISSADDAQRVSGVLEFDARTDELGELSRSINGTYLYLREMSLVAGSLAAGDLARRRSASGLVVPRSGGDFRAL